MSAPLAEVAGKVAFITGGSSGIGAVMRRNDPFIFTNAEFEPPTRERMEALLAAFPPDRAPTARAVIARRSLTDMYARERDRRNGAA
jgi:hypothetical protein